MQISGTQLLHKLASACTFHLDKQTLQKHYVSKSFPETNGWLEKVRNYGTPQNVHRQQSH
jgi:hypothetical protein